MNTKPKTSVQHHKPMMTTAKLMRLAGLSAMTAGLCFLVIGLFHQENIPSSVTTATWVNVHIAATALGFFGLFGLAGLYARQAEKSGWLGLAGFILFSLWMTIIGGFSFVEAFIFPRLATESPKLVESILKMLSNLPSEIDLGMLPTIWNLSGLLIILGPLLFGLATFRARVLPRWAGGLLALGGVWVPVGALVPPAYQPETVMLPIGLAFTWLGYALFAERREKAVETLLDQRSTTPKLSKVA